MVDTNESWWKLRIFVCYARVDQLICREVQRFLVDGHDVFSDQRIYAGEDWWRIIVERLHWCDIVVYLISPDSLNSEYCQDELKIARGLGKPIFPVLIDEAAELPEYFRQYQYADFSHGITGDAVFKLLSPIHKFSQENMMRIMKQRMKTPAAPTTIAVPSVGPNNGQSIIRKALEYLNQGDYDKASFALHQAKQKGPEDPQYQRIVANLMRRADQGVKEVARQKQRHLIYQSIADLLSEPSTFEHGTHELGIFLKKYPDHDPLNLRQKVRRGLAVSGNGARKLPPEVDSDANRKRSPQKSSIPTLEWRIIRSSGRSDTSNRRYAMARYPATNGLQQAFIQAGGYRDERYWRFSPAALAWLRAQESVPESGDSDPWLPWTHVNWFEAMAVGQWLSTRIRAQVTLATVAQWRWAAVADTGWLLPFGNEFNPQAANTRESNLLRSTDVRRYEKFASPFGVVDQIGNATEWCLRDEILLQGAGLDKPDMQPVMGGSYRAAYRHAIPNRPQTYLAPETRYPTLGFRLVALPLE